MLSSWLLIGSFIGSVSVEVLLFSDEPFPVIGSTFDSSIASTLFTISNVVVSPATWNVADLLDTLTPTFGGAS